MIDSEFHDGGGAPNTPDSFAKILRDMRMRLVMRAMIQNHEWTLIADRIEALLKENSQRKGAPDGISSPE